jgi:hypothetical protein
LHEYGVRVGDQPQWYEQILDLQLRNNADIWAQLQEHGVDEDTKLLLGFSYLSPGRDEAERLVSFLVDETDYEVESRTENDKWFVFGVTQPTAVSSELLDRWVEWMVAAGAAEGPCAFDGWEVVGGLGAPPA